MVPTRRQFLVGLFSTTVLATIPASIIDVEATLDWEEAIRQVYNQYFLEFGTYGTAGLRYTTEFPFIQCVTASEIFQMPEINRSTGAY